MICGFVCGPAGVASLCAGDTLRRVGVNINDLVLQHRLAGQVAAPSPLAKSGLPVVLTGRSTTTGETLRINAATTAAAQLADPSGAATVVMIGQPGFGSAFFNGSVGLVCWCYADMPATHRAAIERFAALLTGASYAG